MTLEFSLRRRARRARYMAASWMILLTAILVGTYATLPILAARLFATLSATADNKIPHVEFYVVGVLALSVSSVGFACFLLGRTAFVEIELAARFAAFADALCLAGDNFERLEKATNLIVPGTKYLSVPEIFSVKDLSSVVDLVKELRPK